MEATARDNGYAAACLRVSTVQSNIFEAVIAFYFLKLGGVGWKN